MAWQERLAAAGVEVMPADVRHVRLRHDGREVTVRVVQRRRLHPSMVGEPPERDSLLVAPTASAAAVQRARSAGWSLVTEDGPGWLIFNEDETLELAEDTSTDEVRSRPRGPVPRGTMAVVRRLLLAGPQTQGRLADLAGVTQARVSQVFVTLRHERLVRRSDRGWVPSDWDQLCDWWLEHYPGPGGITTWWAGLAAPGEQVAAAIALAREADLVVSGDVAADLVAPWRLPGLATVYGRQGMDLRAAGLTPLPSQAGATLALTLPEDASVWPREPTLVTRSGVRYPLADGLQILYDLLCSPGPDAADAAAHWRIHLSRAKDDRSAM